MGSGFGVASQAGGSESHCLDAHGCLLTVESFLCRCPSPEGPLPRSAPERGRDGGVATRKSCLTQWHLGRRIYMSGPWWWGLWPMAKNPCDLNQNGERKKRKKGDQKLGVGYVDTKEQLYPETLCNRRHVGWSRLFLAHILVKLMGVSQHGSCGILLLWDFK